MKTKTKQCQTFWRNKKGASCGAVLSSSELPEFVMIRFRQRQQCDIYYVQEDGSVSDKERAGAVWQKDNGRWDRFWFNPNDA